MYFSDKEDIINHIETIPAEDLVLPIRQGVITTRELIKRVGDRFDMAKRARVQELLNSSQTLSPSIPASHAQAPAETRKEVEEVTSEEHPAPPAVEEAVAPRADFSHSGWDEERVEGATPEEIVEAIRRGEVSHEYLVDHFGPAYGRSKRKKVTDILAQSDHDDFAQAQQEDTEAAYDRYLTGHPTGAHVREAMEKKSALVRTEEEQRRSKEVAEEWSRVDKQNKRELRKFCQDHPDTAQSREAEQLLRSIETLKWRRFIDPEEEIKKLDQNLDRTNDPESVLSDFYTGTGLTDEQILSEIRDKHNILRARSVKYLIEYGRITPEDLTDVGISQEVAEYVSRTPLDKLGAMKISVTSPTSELAVNQPCREIYIWGVPSSGKTCAIGAILHSLFQLGDNFSVQQVINDKNKRGYDYAAQLRNAFNPLTRGAGQLIRLVDSTDLTEFFKMELQVSEQVSRKSSRIYPYALMDMAGELMTAIHRSNTEHTRPDDDKMLAQLDKMLGAKSGNRRIHIFCLEYGGENRTIEGIDVQTYLESVGNYLNQKGYLVNDTDAIFVLLTKVDLAKPDENLGKYLKQNYPNFINVLKSICQSYDINGGELTFIPFSLGEVTFKVLCQLNPSFAINFVKAVLLREGLSLEEGGGFASRARRMLRR